MNTVYITTSQYIQLLQPIDQKYQIYYNIDTYQYPNKLNTLYQYPILIQSNTLLNCISYDSDTQLYSQPESIMFIRLLQSPIIYIQNNVQNIYNPQFEGFASSKAFLVYTIDGSIPSPTNGIQTYEQITQVRTLQPYSENYFPIKAIIVEYNSIDSNISYGKLPIPISNYQSGTYTSSILLELSTPYATHDSSSIYYTTNGYFPLPQYAILYTQPILLQQFNNYTIRFLVSCPYWQNSDDVQYNYNITSKVSPITMSLESNTYGNDIFVQLSCPNEGVNIYYTMDGSTPTQSSSLYVQPILINWHMTLNAIGFKDDWVQSEVSSQQYNFKVQDVYTQETQLYIGIKQIQLLSKTSESVIYYSINNMDPLNNGQIYTQSLTIYENLYITAIAIKLEYQNSQLITYEYYPNLITYYHEFIRNNQIYSESSFNITASLQDEQMALKIRQEFAHYSGSNIYFNINSGSFMIISYLSQSFQININPSDNYCRISQSQYVYNN